MRKILWYNPQLKVLARKLRNNSTKSEIILWTHLRNKQMLGFDFHRQKPIANYICDFYCSELNLCIELDGITHDNEHAQIKDSVRTSDLEKLGITVLRFTDREVLKETEYVLGAIEYWIKSFIEDKVDNC